MTLISLPVAYSYLLERRRWVRYLLVVFMVPSAIVRNAIRIIGAGIVAHRFGPNAGECFLHAFSDWVIFLAALILMLGCRWILRHIGKESEEPAMPDTSGSTRLRVTAGVLLGASLLLHP